ncbi:class F sortase [Actinomadura chibensis]|uniref:Class F sortase n=1 Tax=Actinomadura chibensis TaxID=392828 RepID=A0A5D0NHQ7_9ACTN|nr:class F sortase [Actinomadura chibensis]TYB43918.1 class F sortase [Actinomadura chibensis]
MRRWGGVWLPIAAAAVIIGVVLVVFGSHRGGGPPDVPGGGRDGSAATSPEAAAPMARSAPVRIRIPAIGVDAPVLSLGLNADGTVQEPSLTQPSLTSWYNGGAAPGERGPAAFYGHVDTRATGPAVFYDLGRLKPGAEVGVLRRDGRTAVFQITSIEQVPKSRFPTQKVYGRTSDPTIRIMTCGGEFDPSTRHYRDNVIAYGVLTGSTG